MKAIHRFSGERDTPLAGGGLTIGQVATLHNGPLGALVRFIAVFDEETVDVDTYDLELGPYGSFSWTVDIGSVRVVIRGMSDGDMRHPRGATRCCRATLTEAPP